MQVARRATLRTIGVVLAAVSACRGGDSAGPAEAGDSGASTLPTTTVEAPSDESATSLPGATESTTAPGTADSTGSAPDTCGNAVGQLLGPAMPWNTPIDTAPVAADSAAVIDYLTGAVTSDVRFQIDFSIRVLEADATTTRRTFEPTADFFSPDCDLAAVPVPEGGALEGESGYACQGDGDCHLIVLDRAECRLYEQWRANIEGDVYQGGCLAVWSLDEAYGDTLRGDFCTSADAAGLPIAPLLFSADEVAAGQIDHAIRFIVPNANIRADTYVRPGTHSTPATSGPVEAPPYSGRLRLRSDVDISGLSAPAQVVAVAMQTYGIILADAGNVTFTASDDASSTTTWEAAGLGPHDLKALQWSDFEVIDAGAPISWSSGSCARRPVSD